MSRGYVDGWPGKVGNSYRATGVLSRPMSQCVDNPSHGNIEWHYMQHYIGQNALLERPLFSDKVSSLATFYLKCLKRCVGSRAFPSSELSHTSQNSGLLHTITGEESMARALPVSDNVQY